MKTKNKTHLFNNVFNRKKKIVTLNKIEQKKIEMYNRILQKAIRIQFKTTPTTTKN